MTNTYDAHFYDLIRKGCQDSAEAMVPELFRLFEPRSVIDVGCGEGWWLAEFKKLGTQVFGVDGSRAAALDVEESLVANLDNPLPKLGRYDLALSFETAEHLEASSADRFVDDLVALSDHIVFSAAIPAQGGVHHLNEQWSGYWIQKFMRRGYRVSSYLKFRFWNDDRIENWYRQNTLILSRKPEAVPEVFQQPYTTVFDVVHPVLYKYRLRLP